MTRGRRAVIGAAVVLAVAAATTIALARLGHLEGVLLRIEHARAELVALAIGFEVLSFAAYVVLTRAVFSPVVPGITWGVSTQLTLAGVVATRLLTAGGIGGIALTAWALRATGLARREVARRLGAFLVVLYSVFFAAPLLLGLMSAAGLVGGLPQGLAITAAIVGAVVIALALATRLVPDQLERRARRAAQGRGRVARLASRLTTAPAVVGESVALALSLVRSRPSVVAAAVGWWAFDIAVLWATFEMFGPSPAASVLVLAYFVGKIAQTIPVPGGIGPVEGGMIAAFAASGVSLDLAVLAVLAYQAISTWLPVVPGLWAYLRLRGTVAGWRPQAPPRGGREHWPQSLIPKPTRALHNLQSRRGQPARRRRSHLRLVDRP